ncbi:hypothetical protein A3862_04630 [Methylobacterium sp. XJLW]|uniref:hypothetical protein n=1 Tax=Methylobacterium sp. XJLW TaxID=739141 RepID=UPI000DAAD679|nr:hypothetical protein [Methylobacterium sp. XJLW]AWV14877.1 hypothetical protein A3862_04630 [Methylobacterium sp. XJLW]
MTWQSKVPDDGTLRRVIEGASSFRDAAEQLHLSITCVRTHAERLGVRTQFRYGFEKLPSDTALKALLREARKGRGAEALARRLGVRTESLKEEADRLGVECRMQVRAGLPDDETLRREMLTCQSFAELAARYRVKDYMVRNQARRLGIPSPSRRGQPRGGHVRGWEMEASRG